MSYQDNLTPEENEKLMKQKLDTYKRNLDKYTSINNLNRNLPESTGGQVMPSIKFKNGKEAIAEIRV